MGIDHCREGRFLVELELRRGGRRRLLPLFGDGTFVELADVFARIEVLRQQRGRVDG